jgi:D-alanine--poly(phosphoribitol) ligase subunit 2
MNLSIESKIRGFLEETFLFEFGDEVTVLSNLFAEGIIDSFGYVQLIAFLKCEFALTFSDEELISNVLVSCADMTAFVSRKANTVNATARSA